jgi:hypothetical protein
MISQQTAQNVPELKSHKKSQTELILPPPAAREHIQNPHSKPQLRGAVPEPHTTPSPARLLTDWTQDPGGERWPIRSPPLAPLIAQPLVAHELLGAWHLRPPCTMHVRVGVGVGCGGQCVCGCGDWGPLGTAE